MRGAVFLGDRKVELRSFPDPTPGPGEVVLEMKVETAPNSPVTIDPTPHAAVMALTGAWWPLPARIAIPCAFCTASTVIASGTTSSTIAAQENCGT